MINYVACDAWGSSSKLCGSSDGHGIPTIHMLLAAVVGAPGISAAPTNGPSAQREGDEAAAFVTLVGSAAASIPSRHAVQHASARTRKRVPRVNATCNKMPQAGWGGEISHDPGPPPASPFLKRSAVLDDDAVPGFAQGGMAHHTRTNPRTHGPQRKPPARMASAWEVALHIRFTRSM